MEWELRIINFNIMGVHRKIWFLEGVHEKTNIQGGGLPKTGAWTVCRFKRGLGENKGVFLRGWLIPECTLWLSSKF